MAVQMRMAETEPQVPGPGLPRPAPKKVATVHAQKVFCPDRNEQEGAAGQPPRAAAACALAICSAAALELSITFVAFEVFQQVGIEYRGADLVDAHGPFAEVDATAAITAEGEILVGGLHQLLAGGTVERFDFWWLGHRFGSW